MNHLCPGPDCKRQVGSDMLMCRTHWYQVPRALRNRVWAAWRNGEGAGSPEHFKAIDAAIKSVGGES